MTRMRWWIVLVLLSVVIVGVDIVTSPYILFPILFVIPVGIGAWYLGRGVGLGFAVALLGCRIGIVVALESESMPIWAAGVNLGIRMLVLVGLAALVAEVAKQERMLDERASVPLRSVPFLSTSGPFSVR